MDIYSTVQLNTQADRLTLLACMGGLFNLQYPKDFPYLSYGCAICIKARVKHVSSFRCQNMLHNIEINSIVLTDGQTILDNSSQITNNENQD